MGVKLLLFLIPLWLFVVDTVLGATLQVSQNGLSATYVTIKWRWQSGSYDVHNYTAYGNIYGDMNFAVYYTTTNGTQGDTILTNLLPSTTYNVRVTAYTLSNGDVYGDVMFTTLDVIRPATPSASHKEVSSPPGSIAITWREPDEQTYPVVGYLVYANDSITLETALVCNKTNDDVDNCTINNLVPSRQYSFTLYVYDSHGYMSIPNTISATTSAVTPVSRPTLSAPNAQITTDSIYLQWTPSSAGSYAVAGYLLYVNTTALIYNGTDMYFNYTGLFPATTYNFLIYAYDIYGYRSTSHSLSPTTKTATAPEMGGISIGSLTPTTAPLTWTYTRRSYDVAYFVVKVGLSSDPVGSYPIAYQGSNTTYTLRELLPQTNYRANIVAVDIMGLTSNPAGSASFTTSSLIRVTSPSLTSAVATAGSVACTWQASSDATYPVAGYLLYVDDILVYNSTSLTFTVTGLQPGITYRFKLFAIDDHHHLSDPSIFDRTTAFITRTSTPQISAGYQTAISANISWADSSGGTYAFSYYEFSHALSTNSYGSPTYIGTATRYYLTGLIPSSSYKVKVIAYDVQGFTSLSSETTISTNSMVVPSSPPSLSCDSYALNTTCTWNGATAGTYPISHYVLEYNIEGNMPWRLAYNGSNLTYVDYSLPSNVNYYVFKVYAVDVAGNVGDSQTDNVSPAGVAPPTRPTISVTPKGVTANITWTVSTRGTHDFGNYTLTNGVKGSTQYVVYSGNLNYFEVSNLVSTTTYTATIVAYDVMGYGSDSSTTEYQTNSIVLPSAPSISYNSTSPESTTIKWTASIVGTFPIDYYVLDYRPSGGTNYTLAYIGPNLSYEALRLDSTLTYEFRIVAFDTQGNSGISQVINVKQMAVSPPSRPGISASPKVTSADITWATSTPGSYEFGNYTLTLGVKGSTQFVVYSGTQTYFEAQNLQQSTTYTATVVAYDIKGFQSEPSTTEFSTNTANAPSRPTISAFPLVTSANITWTPSTPANYPLSNYTLTNNIKNNSTTATTKIIDAGSALHFEFTGLLPNTTYSVTIVVYDIQGYASTPVTTEYTTAAAPTSPTITVSPGAIEALVTWTESHAKIYPISNYTLYSGLQNDTQWKLIYSGTQLSYTLLGLTPSTPYKVKVIAYDVRGYASEAAEKSFQTNQLGVATAPVITIASLTSNRALVAWSDSMAGTYPIIAYALSIKLESSNTWELIYNASKTLFNITGLAPNTSYVVSIVAVDSQGTIGVAGTKSFKTNATRGAHLGYLSHNIMTTDLIWSEASTAADNTWIVSYSVQYKGDSYNKRGDWVVLKEGIFFAYNVSGLAVSASHIFQVTATDSIGNAIVSNSVAVSFSGSGFAAGNTTRDTARTAWTPVVVANMYKLLKSDTGVGNWIEVATTPNTTFSYIVPALLPSTSYYFKLQSFNAQGELVGSKIAYASTQAPECGDGICDASESCQSCYLDCASTCTPTHSTTTSAQQPTCPGTPACSGHGTCTAEGVCVCVGYYYGASCDQENIPVIVLPPSTSTPTVIIKPTPSSAPSSTTTTPSSSSSTNNHKPVPDVEFDISVVEIQEISRKGDIVDKYSLSLTNNITQQGITVYSNNVTENYVLHKFTISLPNGATVIISILFFSNPTTITFAGETQSLNKDSIKLTLETFYWPFASYANTLAFITKSYTTDTEGCVTQGGDENSLKWIKVVSNGVSLYGSFVQYAMLDDKIRVTQFSWANKTAGLVKMIVPHFYTNAIIDPNYSVLIESDSGSSSGSVDECGRVSNLEAGGDSKAETFPAMYIGAVVGAVGAALVGGVALYFFLKHKRKLSRRGRPLSSFSRK